MAAEAGTLKAVGRSGRPYYVDMYLPDAVGGIVLFNPAGAAAATSLNYWRPPEDVVITDVSVATGTTAVGAVFNLSGAVINGGVIRYANFLNTLASRPTLSISVPAGSLLGAVQI